MDSSLSQSFIKSSTLWGTVAALYIVYAIGLAVYRLYFSPLAKFPGPKLAAISRWYMLYYDAILGGQFAFQIQHLHKQYGPIVRINPFELHIEDSDYFEDLYTGHKEYERYAWMSGRFGANTTTSSTVEHDLHRTRRAPLNPMFSKRSITKFEPLIREKVELLSKGLTTYKESEKVLVVNDAFEAFAGDVITSYCFGFSYDQLLSKDFEDNFHSAYEAVRKFAHIALQFPIAYIILGLSPKTLLKMLAPNIYKMFALQESLQENIALVVNGESRTKSDHPTIFSEVLASNLPSSEKTIKRLGSEAQQMIGAGVETVAWSLTTAVFHLLNNPAALRKLREELQEAIPDPTNIPDSQTLERLPYLVACAKEAIRLSTGVSVRLPRVSPTKPMVYKDWVIPAKTPVAMSTVDVLRDEELFPKPASFIPERWLDHPKTSTGESLSRYYVPFGKGPRMCLGLNLAYVEMHLALAMLFRRFTFELYETDVSDVEMAHDYMLPQPKLTSKGVRVKITSTT